MKILIISDIHGSSYYAEKIKEIENKEKPDQIILLGDLYYHGPRNDLPKDYNPKSVIELLINIKDKILCVRGNCDTEVDQMVLNFPILADYAVVPVKDKLVYLTHGHNFNENNLPPMADGDILLHGHTHVPKCVDHGNYIYMNPGSVSIPKENSWHGYMILEDGSFTWKDFEGEIKMNLEV